ncbi:hypothetical protein [Sinorhizobium meliloti]|jgi:hypothetical protein|uniref:hypothetical protein n=1 Tax=Rhizobium meliloti TaxID=382 RepID=UPI000FD8D4EB|nr:hypothetical protein [Sinorhizobium meliloti]RVK27332.1 hypothetical protein CN163_30935 [Sinorhizobium meliloti]
MLEFRLALLLMSDRDVVNIEDQPAPVWYLMPGETKRRYTIFDFRVTYASGRVEAYAVKAAERVDADEIELIVECVNAQSLEGFADEAFVVTDEFFTIEMAENAEDIVEARKSRNDSDCRAVLEFIRRHDGPVSIHDICDAFEDRGWAKTAILNLIYDGEIEHLDPTETFDESPLVQAVFH